MKHIHSSIAILAASAGIFASCASYEEISPLDRSGETCAPETVTFTASFEQPDTTRTSLDASTWKVKWDEGDRITVFCKYRERPNSFGYSYSTNSTLTVSDISEDGLTATFTGQISVNNISEYYAIYPADEEATFTGSSLKASTKGLAAAQKPVESSFGPQLNIAAAKSTDRSFKFKNLCSLLSFKVDNDRIVSASLTSRSGAALAGGQASIDFSKDTPTITPSGAESTVTMNGGLKKGAKYYFVVYPSSHSSGFTFDFEDNDYSVAEMTSTTALSLNAKDNYFLGSITIPESKFGNFETSRKIGIYSTGGDIQYQFRPYRDQRVWGIKGGKSSFRIQDMGGRLYFNISEMPETFETGSSFTISVTQNLLTSESSTFQETVKVLNTSFGYIRLTGTKHNYIIKQ